MEQQDNTNRVLRIGSIIVTLAFVVLLACLLLPALNRAREQARRPRCLSNLKQIGLHLKQYALDNDDVFVWKSSEQDRYYRFFGRLHPEYADDLEIFRCPSSSDRSMSARTNRKDGDLFKESECRGSLSYAYGHNQAKPWTEEARDTVRIAADKYATEDYAANPNSRHKPANHNIKHYKRNRLRGTHQIGRNIVCVDGSARWDNNWGPLEADPDWDINAGVSITDPEYEPDENSDPKHDQTGPDWWTDPPDK